jgi:GT2 family glycosyltransferase
MTMLSDAQPIDVSVIIISHNNLHLLENCVNSLIEFNKNFNYEIIIVDNNSAEGDISKIVSGIKGIKLICNKINIGFASANNQGIKIAKGKYLLILNNDTIFFENTIKKIFDYAETFPEKIFIGCKLIYADGSNQDSISSFDNIYNYFGEKLFLYKVFTKSKTFNRFYQNYLNLKIPVDVDIIKGAFMFCDAKSVKEMNGFDERFFFYGEEVDLCKRFKVLKGRIIYYPLTSIIHLGGATVNNYKWFDLKNQVIARIQILQKHYYGVNFVVMLFLHYFGIFLRIFVYSVEGIITLNRNQLLKAYYYIKQFFIYPSNKFND